MACRSGADGQKKGASRSEDVLQADDGPSGGDQTSSLPSTIVTSSGCRRRVFSPVLLLSDKLLRVAKPGRNSIFHVNIKSECTKSASLMSSVSSQARWMSEPGTERGLDYFFLLQGLDKDGKLRPTEISVDGGTLPVKHLTKGQIHALM